MMSQLSDACSRWHWAAKAISCSQPSAIESRASDSLPDVMLLDLRMPRMDGATLLMTMQSDARLRSLPVIALSAAPGMNDGGRLGVAAYLDKPFNLDVLLTAIAAILERGEMLRASS